VEVFGRIFREAFTGTAAAGGAMGIGFQQAMMIGVRRAAFSNEAGLGTAPLAHGAARTNEPVREGLVAMLGPFIDTIVVCSLTAFVILSSGLETVGEITGVSLTADAVQSALGAPGRALLVLIVMMFAISTMVSYSYYGKRCFAYLFGARRDGLYTWLYLLGIFVGAIFTASTVINLIDTALAMMAVPNLIATLLLAPKVKAAATDYFNRLRAERRGSS
ncbi:MAG: alanine:cation symporter family protein, partial [Acidobacteriota bacterium]|nr:alanine:cation symporter family protein [Acidobacteriota bacterium]